MFEGIKKGFRNPKKPNRKQVEAEEKSRAFIKAYEAVCIEHGLQLDAKIEVTPDGVIPRIRIEKFEPKQEEFETKSWEECRKLNAETKKKKKEIDK